MLKHFFSWCPLPTFRVFQQSKFEKRSFHLSPYSRSIPQRQKKIDRSILSVLDMYSVGVGPSSSHTVGPMRAANMYTNRLKEKNLIESVRAVRTQLYGSLALTGEGHGTPKAILMGLEGQLPETVDPTIMVSRVCDIRTKKELNLAGFHKIYFDNDMLQLLKTEVLPHHSNGILFSALGENGEVVDSQTYYSIGGGFVLTDDITNPSRHSSRPEPPLMFHTGAELLSLCKKTNLSISQLQLQNEMSFGKTEMEISIALHKIWNVMNDCIERGLNSKEKILPGGLNVRRRAPEIFQRLRNHGTEPNGSQEHIPNPNTLTNRFPSSDMDWLSVYAMAVNEENAAGGRVVTAPTNGAAGVIPAVLRYYVKWSRSPVSEQCIVDYLMTAGTIGILFKKGASISAAEVGCQGEIGVACSMAAAGLCALYGGTPTQIANAAEIGMEHHLGMTCDPIGGLVQIPCIERNTMGSIKAVNAAHLALLGDGNNIVSLDTVIATMMKTGYDMQTTYKETSLGGLAVHIGNAEC